MGDIGSRHTLPPKVAYGDVTSLTARWMCISMGGYMFDARDRSIHDQQRTHAKLFI